MKDAKNAARLFKQSENARLRLPKHTRNKPLVIVGPSGVGKGTLEDHLWSKFSDKFGYSVSYTTRKIRPGEVDG